MKILLKPFNFIEPTFAFGLNLFGAAVLLAFSASALATYGGGGSTIHVNCDGEGDMAAIQAAVDAAPKDGTVQINGHCLLNDDFPVYIDKSNLTITGNPHASYYHNPSNMTVMQGTKVIIDEMGNALQGDGRDENGCFANRSFFIASLDPNFSGEIKNVTIKNIKFVDQWSAVWVMPSIEHYRTTQTATDCDALVEENDGNRGTPLNASAKNITFKNNQMTGVIRGAQFFGNAKNVYVLNNHMDGLELNSINVRGLGISESHYAEYLKNMVVQGNHSQGDGLFMLGIYLTGVEDALVIGNHTQGGEVGIYLTTVTDALVIGNKVNEVIDNETNITDFGIYLYFSEGGLVIGNDVQNGDQVGIGVESDSLAPELYRNNLVMLNNVEGSTKLGGYNAYLIDGGVSFLFNKGSNNTAIWLGLNGPADIVFDYLATNNLSITTDCDMVVYEDAPGTNTLLGQEHCQ